MSWRQCIDRVNNNSLIRMLPKQTTDEYCLCPSPIQINWKYYPTTFPSVQPSRCSPHTQQTSITERTPYTLLPLAGCPKEISHTYTRARIYPSTVRQPPQRHTQTQRTHTHRRTSTKEEKKKQNFFFFLLRFIYFISYSIEQRATIQSAKAARKNYLL